MITNKYNTTRKAVWQLTDSRASAYALADIAVSFRRIACALERMGPDNQTGSGIRLSELSGEVINEIRNQKGGDQ